MRKLWVMAIILSSSSYLFADYSPDGGQDYYRGYYQEQPSQNYYQGSYGQGYYSQPSQSYYQGPYVQGYYYQGPLYRDRYYRGGYSQGLRDGYRQGRMGGYQSGYQRGYYQQNRPSSGYQRGIRGGRIGYREDRPDENRFADLYGDEEKENPIGEPHVNKRADPWMAIQDQYANQNPNYPGAEEREMQEQEGQRGGNEYPQDRGMTPADIELNKRIRHEIAERLFRRHYGAIIFRTANGIVVVEGEIENPRDEQRLLDELRRIAGVRGVTINLNVRRQNPQPQQ